MGGAAPKIQHRFGDFGQARTENRVRQVGAGFRERIDRVALRRCTQPKPGKLREDLPHPVRPLAATSDLRQRTFVLRLLRTDEAVQIERIAHSGRNASSTLPAPAPLPDSPAYPDVMNSVPPATVGPGPLIAPPFASTPFTVVKACAVSYSQSTFPSLVE